MPIIRSFFLLSWIIIKVWFQIHLPDILFLRHVLCWIDSFFHIILVFFSCQSKLKAVVLRLTWHFVFSIYCFTQGLSTSLYLLPFEGLVLLFLKVVDEVANSLLVSNFHDFANAFWLFCWNSISKIFMRLRIIDKSIMFLHIIGITMIVPCCSLYDFLYFFMCSGVFIGW